MIATGRRQALGGIARWLAALAVLPVAAALAAPPGAADGPPGVADRAAERAALDARIQEVRQLLGSMDALESHLTALARQALEDSDLASSLDERRRYERLYRETSARLGELKATRRDIQRQLERLESQLGDAQGER